MIRTERLLQGELSGNTFLGGSACVVHDHVFRLQLKKEVNVRAGVCAQKRTWSGMVTSTGAGARIDQTPVCVTMRVWYSGYPRHIASGESSTLRQTVTARRLSSISPISALVNVGETTWRRMHVICLRHIPSDTPCAIEVCGSQEAA